MYGNPIGGGESLMRIRTDGDKAWRVDVIEAAAESIDRNKTAAITTACEHLVADIEAKRELAEYLADEQSAGRLSDEQIQTIAEIFDSSRIHAAPSYSVERQSDATVGASSNE